MSATSQQDQRPSRPLAARIDPGWLFVLVGLAVLVAGILVPAWRQNQGLQDQLSDARQAESRAVHRLDRTVSMLDQLTSGEGEVHRRVSMAERNEVQPGDELVLRDLGAPAEVLQWLDASVDQADQIHGGTVVSAQAISSLEAVATGPSRLWFLAAGAMCLCLGLVLGPSSTRPWAG
ncbi:MAG: hypothetical protein MK116_08090 [Phycisphaerales bacterium]|nr:hypothetical protein [Phycisphaerales bacterium]